MGKRFWFLLCIGLGVLLSPLNSSMIAVAVIRIQTVFHLSFATVSWLITVYYLTSAVAQPIMGKVSDLIGPKKVFMGGLVMVAAASVATLFAPTFSVLLVLRLFQAWGSGSVYPAAMAIVRGRVEANQAQALAFLAVFSSASAAFGPTIGGILLQHWNWQAIFWFNLPIIVISFSMAVWLLPASRPKSRGSAPRPLSALFEELDVVGTVEFVAALGGILLWLLSPHTLAVNAMGFIGLVALGLFARRETRVASPFIPVRAFAENPALIWVDGQFMVVNIIFYSVFFSMADYLEKIRHFSAQDTGMLMFFISGTAVLIAPLTGRWVARSGSRPGLLLASLLMTAGSLLMVGLQDASPTWLILAVLVAFGASNGLNNVGMQTALFEHSPKKVIGTASGLFMTSRYLGTIVSSVLLGLAFNQLISSTHLRELSFWLTALSLLVIGLSWHLPKGKRQVSPPTVPIPSRTMNRSSD